MDVLAHNRSAWNYQVDQQNRWTRPVRTAAIKQARTGKFSIVLTPTIPVPTEWFPELAGTPTLCLASAGGQQAPLLAAAGAQVTVFDNSPKQLDQDRLVADRDNLKMEFVTGDMADLSAFEDNRFGLIFHPCSNCFAADVIGVWRECFRVLRPGGILLAGFCNPVRYIFDDERKENGSLEVCYKLPYSDLDHLDREHVQDLVRAKRPLEFSHTLEDQIGGQLRAGLMLTGFYEDRYAEADQDPISQFMPTFIATRAIKPN
jgi:SAM-dependent methyltransferase